MSRGIDVTTSPLCPLPKYWCPHLISIVAVSGQQMANDNHYRRMAINENISTESSLSAQIQDLPDLSLIQSTTSSFTSPPFTRGDSVDPSQHNTDENDRRLPDVVNVRLRNQMGNGHNHGRRSASINLPIDQETLRTIGMSLRRISEEFEIRRSRSREMQSDTERGGVMRYIFASVRVSRPSVSSRIRSHHINLNGRPRSYSSNDAAAADVEE